MRSLSSITGIQWVIIIILELAAIFVYLEVIPWLVLSMDVSPSPTTDLAAELFTADSPLPTQKPMTSASPTKRPAAVAPRSTNTPGLTKASAPTAIPTLTPKPTAVRLTPSAFADLAMNPRAMLASKTTFFTSVCFGEGTNLLQDRDYMAPADWSSSPDRKCIFGYAVNPLDRLPLGRY